MDSFYDKILQAGIDIGGDVADIILQTVGGIAEILFHAAKRIDDRGMIDAEYISDIGIG